MARATRRRGSSSPRRAGPRRGASPMTMPEPGPGERIWVLDVPYGTQLPDVRWHTGIKAHLHVARNLRPDLEPYASLPHTLSRFQENTLNPESPVAGDRPAMVMEPRTVQEEGATAIAARAAAGGRMFLLADEPGVGKTITAVLGANRVGRQRNAVSVLVVADRPAAITIGHWCRTVAALGDDRMDWVVITWDRLEKVAGHPWDVVIADEAHALRNMTTKRWKQWVRVSGHAKPAERAPFVIALTATPGHTPLELPYLAPGWAQALGQPLGDWVASREAERPKAFAEALEREGLGIERGRYGPAWTDEPARRAVDLAQVRGWLASAEPPAMMHRAAAWGQVPISGMPVTLTAEQRAAYDSQWGEFCAEMDLARRGRSVSKGRAALLRFRQKAGLIRVESTVDWIVQQVGAGRQVACSVEFVTTAADPIADRLAERGLEVARIYGRDRFDPEAQRLSFQTGRAPVVVFTAVASMSLHAGEMLPDGTRATDAPRVGVFHQPRFSGISGRQITGRTHRDHQVSPWHIAYAQDTVEERVGKVMVERIAAASDTVGAETGGLVEVAALLGADWLPATALTEDK